jgi:hypothetical protein
MTSANVKNRYNQIWFWYRCQFPKWRDWNIEYTPKGLVKLIIRRGFRVLAIIALILGYRRFQKFNQFRKNSELAWKDILNLAKMAALGQAAQQLGTLRKKLITMM